MTSLKDYHQTLLDVVNPASTGPGDELLRVQPEGEPVVDLVAPVAHCRRLVQPCLDLATSVARYCSRQRLGDRDDKRRTSATLSA